MAKPERLPARERVPRIMAELDRLYPDPSTALDYRTPLQLLVATILSAQCTDKRVNMVTPALFARFPDAPAFAAAPIRELEKLIRSTGFFRAKARAIREMSRSLVQNYAGEVPRTLEELVRLPGVGRKTANVVLGDAFGVPGVTVDTHVGRLSRRLGLTRHTDAVKVEHDLMRLVPETAWTRFSHQLILHGRAICTARNPKCDACPLHPHCPKIGVVAKKSHT